MRRRKQGTARMAGSDVTLWIVDDVTAKPGAGEAFLRAYLERYVPGAQAQGLVLRHRLVAPPVWLPDQPNRLLFIWTAQGAAGVWASKFAGRSDPLLAEWWEKEAAALIESRIRAVYCDPDDVAALADV